MKYLVVTLISLVVGFCLGFYIFKQSPTTVTETVERVDTLYISKPTAVVETVVDTAYIRVDSLIYITRDSVIVVKDTVQSPIITLPITQKIYSDPNSYKLAVSGYNPALDWIEVYNTTIESTTYIKDVYKHSISASLRAGYDTHMHTSLLLNYTFYNNRLSVTPSLGYDLYSKSFVTQATLSYDLIRW